MTLLSIQWRVLESTPLGSICLAATAKGIVFLNAVEVRTSKYFSEGGPGSAEAVVPNELSRAIAAWKIQPESLKLVHVPADASTTDIEPFPSLDVAASRLTEYLDSLDQSAGLRVPTDDALCGTPVDWTFLEDHTSATKAAVWKVIASIPRGDIWDYSRVAKEAGCAKAIRNVATVIGSNFVPLIVPCHRVCGKDGKMRGFSFPGGLDVKRRLLKMETGRVFAR
ncbi:methylated-DNA--cysteine S-met [Rhizoclosmatium globosum]|uniref:Methylated-DNA--protein-cysteine methyltransferase n=1 Tax=Rhizoclosmatium globosum TaxID=329046 RepID=A0A1Y2D0B7_9FUNG|nr:methylated-DNA--cysteine S-met [Rhizoclosmatium globosum]|eukprot:ORY52045.1 methylated-DNA--cysteine S-met [Rhizoclosmatium globosum]